jgi:hypothetical protein
MRRILAGRWLSRSKRLAVTERQVNPLLQVSREREQVFGSAKREDSWCQEITSKVRSSGTVLQTDTGR